MLGRALQVEKKREKTSEREAVQILLGRALQAADKKRENRKKKGGNEAKKTTAKIGGEGGHLHNLHTSSSAPLPLIYPLVILPDPRMPLRDPT